MNKGQSCVRDNLSQETIIGKGQSFPKDNKVRDNHARNIQDYWQKIIDSIPLDAYPTVLSISTIIISSTSLHNMISTTDSSSFQYLFLLTLPLVRSFQASFVVLMRSGNCNISRLELCCATVRHTPRSNFSTEIIK